MTTNNDKKAAEDCAFRDTVTSDTTINNLLVTEKRNAFLAGCAYKEKELEQIAREAFIEGFTQGYRFMAFGVEEDEAWVNYWQQKQKERAE